MTFYWWKPGEVGSGRERGRDFAWERFPVALKSTQSAVCTFVLLPEPSGSSEPGFSHQMEYSNSE